MIANLVLISLLPVGIMAMIGWRLVADHRRRLSEISLRRPTGPGSATRMAARSSRGSRLLA